MDKKQRRELVDELRARTPHERKQIEAGLFHVIEIASDANIDVGELHDIYDAVRALTGERVGRRPNYRPRRYADHE